MQKNLIAYFITILLMATACEPTANTEKIPVGLAALNKAIKEKPQQANLYFERGQLYEKEKMDSLAVNDYLEAIALDSTKSIYYSNAARLLFDRKDPRSIPLIQRALVLNPNDVNSHLKIATIQYYNKKYADAFQSINTVLKTDVYNYDAYFLKGQCYKELGDTTTAISSFETALRMQPDKQAPYMQLAILTEKKDPKRAIQYYENAFRADTLDAEPLNGIGMVYANKKDNVAAKAAFTRCIMQRHTYAKAYYNMACLLMDEDSTDKAIRNLNIAIQHDPQYADAYYNRGLCNAKIGKPQDAKSDFEQTLSLQSNHTLARAALAKY